MESDPTFRIKFCIKLEERQIDLEKVINKFNEIQKIKNYNVKIKEWAERNINSKIKIASSNEELFFLGIDHTGAALLKNTNGEIITYQESSLSVLNLY